MPHTSLIHTSQQTVAFFPYQPTSPLARWISVRQKASSSNKKCYVALAIVARNIHRIGDIIWKQKQEEEARMVRRAKYEPPDKRGMITAKKQGILVSVFDKRWLVSFKNRLGAQDWFAKCEIHSIIFLLKQTN